jgi:apolipoprotein N-acyltransferase
MTAEPAAPAAHAPSVESTVRPRWRPSNVRMTHRRNPTVVPRRGMVALPALASGVGLALSLPPWGWWILAFPSAGLLWWRLGGLRPRTRLWAGYLAGLGCYIPGLMWARSFTVPGAIVLIAVEAGFTAVACLVVPAGGTLARALAYPAALTLAEAARMAWPFGGLPLGGVFLGQAGGPVLGVARLGGPLGLTAMVYVGGVAVGALGEAAARAVRDGARARAFATRGPDGVNPTADGAPAAAWRRVVSGAVAGLGPLALAGVVAGVVVVGVSAGADHAPDGGGSVGTVSAAAVQGGGKRGFSKSQINPSVVLAAQMSETRRLEGAGVAPQLVLWPEDVVSLATALSDSPEQSVLSTLARTLHTTLVVGVTEDISATAFRNEVVAFGPDGTLVSRYEKVHRVPFGEYVPYRGFFSHLANLSAVPLDAVPGTGTGLLPTPAAPLGAMISYEVFYADRGRSSVRDGAQLLIVPTNTSSYATAQVPTQEIAASRVQAVQQGRDLLQAAPTGYSAAITNRGVLLQRSVLGAPQIVAADLSRRAGWTVYVRFGDLPPLVLAAVALVAGWLVAGRRNRIRAPRHQGTS